MRMDEEQKTKAIARETLANADRRAHTLQNALEESRTMLEQADRARRAAEQELQVRQYLHETSLKSPKFYKKDTHSCLSLWPV